MVRNPPFHSDSEQAIVIMLQERDLAYLSPPPSPAPSPSHGNGELWSLETSSECGQTIVGI